MRTIVIDCNNLIHKIPAYKKKFREQKDAVALSLIESVKSKFNHNKIIFVFDGFSDIQINNVIFSGKITADEIIRKYIEENYYREPVSIVSSDTGITNLAKICGCEVKSSEEFWKELKPSPKKKDKNINQLFYPDGEKPDRITKKELDEFKKHFS